MNVVKNWPDIPYERWAPSGNSLRMWAQIVGKFRLAATPWINHSWQAAFYVNARGLTSSLIPGKDASYETVFDFVDHALRIHSTDGRSEAILLEPMSVADFHRKFVGALESLGAPTDFHGTPNEVPDPVPFAQQTEDGAWDPQAVHDFWQALVRIDNVFKHFRTAYLGKTSPSHLFWGSFDLAITRFSGRPAPLHPGGIPALPDEITREAYSHEVSSAGFWPGGNGVDHAAFYSYAYPTPEGFGDASPGHPDAWFLESLGEFILPYDSVREAPDPEAALLSFLQATYDAAAELGGWNRAALECELGQPRRPRSIV